MIPLFPESSSSVRKKPAALEALSSFKILRLPSASTLKAYMNSHKEAPGECSKRLAQERKLYDETMAQSVKEGSPTPPLREGALIIDEVKVTAKLHWNSRDDSIVGHSMSDKELATLCDLYQSLDDPEATKADYVLQTLWRDLSTERDVVGPHYTTTGTFAAKYMLACVMDSMRQFHSFGVSISLLICNGASANLTMLKVLLGVGGVFSSEHKISTSSYIGRNACGFGMWHSATHNDIDLPGKMHDTWHNTINIGLNTLSFIQPWQNMDGQGRPGNYGSLKKTFCSTKPTWISYWGILSANKVVWLAGVPVQRKRGGVSVQILYNNQCKHNIPWTIALHGGSSALTWRRVEWRDCRRDWFWVCGNKWRWPGGH